MFSSNKRWWRLPRNFVFGRRTRESRLALPLKGKLRQYAYIIFNLILWIPWLDISSYCASWEQYYLQTLLELVLFTRIIISLKVLFLEFKKEAFKTKKNWRLSSLLIKFCRCPYLRIKLFIYVRTLLFIIFEAFWTIEIYKFLFYGCFKVNFYYGLLL